MFRARDDLHILARVASHTANRAYGNSGRRQQMNQPVVEFRIPARHRRREPMYTRWYAQCCGSKVMQWEVFFGDMLQV